VAEVPRRGTLAARLVVGQALVIVAGAGSLVIVAIAIAPAIFHDHVRAALGTVPAGELAHLDHAFQDTLLIALGVAVPVALVTALAIGLLLATRIASPIDRLARAAERVAAGEVGVRVAVGGADELRALSASFNAMAVAFERSELQRRAFVADVAHELRTPVATIAGYVDGLEDGVVAADAAAWAVLRDQASRMRRLVDDLSTLARADEGTIDLRPEPLGLAAVLHRAANAASGAYAARQVTLIVDATAGSVDADPDRLSQVLANLLGNAVRHTPPGGRVTLSGTVGDGASRIVVADTGEGIPAEELDRVFDRLHRVDAARGRDRGGTGLGLTISQALIDAHGGTIRAESGGPGLGSRFTIDLPTGRPQPASAEPLEPAMPTTTDWRRWVPAAAAPYLPAALAGDGETDPSDWLGYVPAQWRHWLDASPAPRPQSRTIEFIGVDEDRPGPRWRALHEETWPAYRRWWLQHGPDVRPDREAAAAALALHMPELVETYRAMVALAGDDDDTAAMLALWNPPPFIVACSQAVAADATTGEPVLVRNYDYDPRLFEATVYRSRWATRRVIGTGDCLWGLVDGMNDAGLAVSLTFGGRREVGDGFGVPLVIRYVLEVCDDVEDGIEVLRRLPHQLSYNVTLADRSGRVATVRIAPDHPAVVTAETRATNHPESVEWPEHAAWVRSVERLDHLALLQAAETAAEALVDSMLAPPLIARQWDEGFATLYTAAYRPRSGTLTYHWPGATWQLDVARPLPAAFTIELGR
jgi:signal transduction histidine kinase/predicted choloylglycine hydrolase